MKQFTIQQAADAMGVDTADVYQLLTRSDIYAENGQLTVEQIIELMDALHRQSQEAENRARHMLEQLADQFSILIDTCSLLHPQFPLLMDHLTPLLQRQKKALLIPSGVMHELRDLMGRKPELHQRIRELLPRLAELRQKGLISVFGGDAVFGDQQMLEVVLHYITSTDLLVITQDRGLTQDLIDQKRLHSVRGRKLLVNQINQYGYLSLAQGTERSFSGSRPRWHWERTPDSLTPISREAFGKGCEDIPGEGEMVFGETGCSWRLDSPLASGGEGSVYDLKDGTAAKIYRPGKIDGFQENKLRLMVSTQVQFPGICWPRELLYNSRHQAVGYRMERAGGMELQRCLFTRAALERHFPDWKKRDMVQLCITILEKICVLHDNGILLGDINPLNILVESPTDVWFVDCDSYQIGRYPCPVGTERFTAPEIQKQIFSTFLRTRGNENFAIATLLFMIMLPGKAPYSRQGGEDMGELIRAMQFPYPCGNRHGANTPEGGWKFMWSHLPYEIKESFYETFQKGGMHSREENRLNAWKWLHQFRYYLRLLDSNTMEDPESREIYPTRFKTVDEEERNSAVRRVCSCCGEIFEISAREQEYFKQNGYVLPTRCPLCRKVRRMMREQEPFSRGA